MSCTSGWSSHLWSLTIEESRVFLSTDECASCNDEMRDSEMLDYIEMRAIDVRLEMKCEDMSPDGLYPFLLIEPIAGGNQ